MTAHAPASATECIFAAQLVAETRGALADIAAAGFSSPALHMLQATAAVEAGRLDRQIVASFAGLEHTMVRDEAARALDTVRKGESN